MSKKLKITVKSEFINEECKCGILFKGGAGGIEGVCQHITLLSVLANDLQEFVNKNKNTLTLLRSSEKIVEDVLDKIVDLHDDLIDLKKSIKQKADQKEFILGENT